MDTQQQQQQRSPKDKFDLQNANDDQKLIIKVFGHLNNAVLTVVEGAIGENQEKYRAIRKQLQEKIWGFGGELYTYFK